MAQVKILPSRNNSSNTAAHSLRLTLTLLHQNRNGKNPWARLLFDTWSLGLETSAVVASRTMKIAPGGRAAKTEMRRMVAEKIEAALSLQALAITGGLGTSAQSAAQTALRHYRRRVRANRRRLARR
jgi:hypothetical protein